MILRAGSVLNDRYEILGTVGAGGMADVYRARDNVLKRLVAIKVLKEEFSTDAAFVAKFRREAQAVGALNHPNIVGVFDVGEQSGMYFIVMELVEGINLKKYIEKTGVMDEREAVEVAMQVAKGLEAAHDQGIIHRDIKPQNIIISREGKIKVADFGIARMISTETATTSTMGSVHYISPEQARGGACDARSDVYSLGISLYEMVTGQVPFDGDSSVTVALKHVQERIQSPRELNPRLSPNLEKIILKCTQKNPVYRYASMKELLVDFRKLIVMPQEDFVHLPEEGANDPNIAIRREDSDILKVAGISARKNNWESEEKAVKAYEEGVAKAIGLQEEDRIAEEKAKRTENLLTYVMLGIGVLILLTIIAIVFKACALLTPQRKTTTAWRPTEITTSPWITEPKTSATIPPTTMPTDPTTSGPTTTPAGTVMMKNLVGMDYALAMETLLNDGLRVNLEYELIDEDSDIEENTVVDQSYEPGVSLLLNTEVTIWIATRDSSTLVVPTTVIGKTVEEAGAVLREMGLVVSSGTEWENSSIVAAGLVMGTTPSVGSLVAKGTPITLIISSGPAMFKMPSVLGYTKEEAIAALNAAGFDTATNLQIRTNTVESDVYLPNTVALVEASTSGNLRTVAAGESVDLRAIVYLTLTNPNPVLPDLLGREDVEEAVEELKQLGLKVLQARKASEEYPVGQICWVTKKDGKTEIPHGTVLKKGDTVMLHISAPAVPTGLKGLTVAEAIEILTEAELAYKFKDDIEPKDPTRATVTAVSPKEGKVLEEDDSAVTISFKEEEETTVAPTTEETTTAAPETTTAAEKVVMPDVYGKTEAEAEAELKALGLKVKKVSGHSSYEAGQVYFVSTDGDDSDNSHEIPGGTKLDPGTTVYIHISEGPAETTTGSDGN